MEVMYIDNVQINGNHLAYPKAGFSNLPNELCAGRVVSYQDTSLYSNTVKWFFNGGSPDSSISLTPQVIYPNAGQYPVTLIAYNVNGNDTLTENNFITVYPNPNVIISSVATGICRGDSIALNAAGAAQYLWEPVTFLANSAIANPIARPLTSTYFIVTGTDDNNCSSKDSILITVGNKIPVNLGADTSVCSATAFSLNAGPGFASYIWNTGDTMQTINVSHSGMYSVTTADSGCNNYDSITIVEINCANGIKTLQDFFLNIYPNPAKDNVSIEVPQSAVGWMIEVYDITSRVIMIKQVNSPLTTLHTDALMPGVYIVKLRGVNAEIGIRQLVIE